MKFGLTTYIAYAFFIGGGTLSLLSPPNMMEYVIVGSGLASVLGFAYLLISKMAFKRIVSPHLEIDTVSEHTSLSHAPSTKASSFLGLSSALRSLIPILLAQTLFLLLSWIFFYTMEFQTRINVRLQPLEPGTLVELMRARPWALCFCPWLCFAVCGVGLAYLSICLQRSPILPAAMFPEYRRHPSLFLRYYSQVVIDTVLLGPPIFLFALTTVWCAEALSVSFGWSSLFLYPWKSTMGFVIIVLVFRNSHQKLLDTFVQRKMPLGGLLALYALGIAVFLFWVHSFGSWFTFGVESTDPNEVMKSPLAGSFSQEELTNRLQLLIWGWWAIWTPHFASLIARLSIGKRVYEACIHSILLPACVFIAVLPEQNREFLQLLFPVKVSSLMHWIIAAFLLFSLMLIFGQTRNTADIQRISMPSGLGKPIRSRPLKKWFMSMIAIYICYMTGEYLLGWVPSQVVVTLGAIFMMSVVFIFLGVLFSTRDHSEDAKRYKVPNES